MPKYELKDLQNIVCWARFADGSYLVDIRYEQEFLDTCRRGLIV